MDSKCSGVTIHQKLITLMIRAKRHMFVICESRNITPVQGMLMISLKPGVGKTMHGVANMMGCDASNVTGLTDRLEENGFIVRVADENDRRVKKIMLTDDGARCRETILEELEKTQSLDLSKLTDDELKTLHCLLSKLM